MPSQAHFKDSGKIRNIPQWGLNDVKSVWTGTPEGEHGSCTVAIYEGVCFRQVFDPSYGEYPVFHKNIQYIYIQPWKGTAAFHSQV